MTGVRLWITGAGLVTGLGAGRDAIFKALVRGERAIRPIELFDTAGQRTHLGAEVRGIAIANAGAEGARGAWSRTSVMAVTAAREAMGEAKLDPKAMRVGLVVGATTGGMFETEALLAKLHADPSARDALASMLSHPLSSTADRFVEHLGPFTRVRTICSACSSGANALVIAAAWLLNGDVDAVVAGGSDGLCRLTFTGFNALGAVDPEPCKPFDRRRRGLTLGEGAGFVVIERASQATTRDASPIAELTGWAMGAEAHHITNPDPRGEVVADLIERAVRRSGLPGIDYVNAHGTGTRLNDEVEAGALARAFGSKIREIPVSSSKGQIGHTLGAAGAIEAVLTAMTIERRMLLPTAGLEEPDPACELQHVLRVGRPAHVRTALSNSFGFGGMDTVLAFSEPELGPPKSAVKPRAVVVTGVAALNPTALYDASTAGTLLESTTRACTIDTAHVDAVLDLARARRLDRPARLAATVVERALAEAKAEGPECGVILGSAFGSVDASAGFMHRMFEKGPRLASPAEFPNLVPSSPVGHVSIYLGLRGPVFATADLATSGESAIAQAVQLIRAGEAARLVAGAYEEKSAISERVFTALFAGAFTSASEPRTEGAAALVFEDGESAAARGVRVLAEVAQIIEWRGGDFAALGNVAPPSDPDRAAVVFPRASDALASVLLASPWGRCKRFDCAAAGEHEGLGAVAMVVAVAQIAAGVMDEALVVGLARDRGFAIRLTARR